MDNLCDVPFDAEAEQAVIGSVLIDARCLPDILPILKPDDFYISANREIYQAATELFEVGGVVDPIVILDKLGGHPKVKEYVLQLMELTPTAAHARVYAEIVKRRSRLRAVQQAALTAAERAAAGAEPDELYTVLQNAQDALCDARTDEVCSVVDIALTLYDELEARRTRGGQVPGLATGFRRLDEQIGGLRGGNVVIIAARSGMGKSAIALNIAVNVAKLYPAPVLIFSLEMTSVELLERVLADCADIDLQKLRCANLSDGEWGILTEAAGRVSGHALRVVDSSDLDISAISRICRGEKPGLVAAVH